MSNRKLIDDLRGFECSDAVGNGDFELCQIAADALEKHEWQPIETAPRDGTEILLARGERVTYGHWLVNEGGTREHRDLDGNWIGQDDSDGFEMWMSWDGGFTEEEPPTHWMHKPAPPSTA